MKPGYAYPFFLTLSGVASATSDILQQPMIANLFIGLLVMTAAISLLGYRFSSVNRAILESLPDNIRPNFSPRPFAISCLVMAALVGGFSVLSAKASNDDGLIASAFPEIRALQQQLGIVQQDVARIDERTEKIEGDTKFLKLAANQWFTFEINSWSAHEMIDPGGPNSMNLGIMNDSAFTYGDVRVHVRDTATGIDWSYGGFMLTPGAFDREQLDFRSDFAEGYEICVSAVRREDGALIREIRKLGDRIDHAKTDKTLKPGGSFSYRVIDTTGLEIVREEESCKV